MEPSADSELLAAWVEHRRESAFHALVARYTTLVHMAAKRTCGDDSLAAEASQLVFILLAQKANSLTTHPTLAGWLHVTAVMKTRDLVDKSRRESRKRRHFSAAVEIPTHPAADDAWREMQPVLDDALAALSDKDREAILLRFYRSLSVREIATTLGIATDAAQKRIDRATERLRGKLARRGCLAGSSLAATMVAGFTADAQAAVPAVSLLASKATAASVAGSGIFTSLIATMKTTYVAAPLAVLIVGGIWLASQFRSIAELEAGNEALRKQLTNRIAGIAVPATQVPRAVSVLDKKPVDWEEVARQLSGKFAADIFPSTSLRLHEKFLAMTSPELSAALDEIAVARLSDKSRDTLEEKLGNLLMEKDLETGLTRFALRAQEGDWSWRLAAALENWAMKDPDRAAAWLAAQIAAGVFQTKRFEGEVYFPNEIVSAPVFALLVTAPEAAGRMLRALPENLRLGPLGAIQLTQLEDAQHVAWAEMVRANLSAEDHLKAITYPTGNWSDGDGAPMTLAETTAYLSRISATPEEVAACVLSVIEDVSSWRNRHDKSRSLADDVAALRAWTKIQAPALIDSATGIGLAAAARSAENFPEVVSLALRFQGISGNDELLTRLLDSDGASENQALARTLAERLSDPKKREEYLRNFQ